MQALKSHERTDLLVRQNSPVPPFLQDRPNSERWNVEANRLVKVCNLPLLDLHLPCQARLWSSGLAREYQIGNYITILAMTCRFSIRWIAAAGISWIMHCGHACWKIAEASWCGSSSWMCHVSSRRQLAFKSLYRGMFSSHFLLQHSVHSKVTDLLLIQTVVIYESFT